MSESPGTRRTFLKTAALLGGSAAAASQAGVLARLGTAEADGYLAPTGTTRWPSPRTSSTPCASNATRSAGSR